MAATGSSVTIGTVFCPAIPLPFEIFSHNRCRRSVTSSLRSCQFCCERRYRNTRIPCPLSAPKDNAGALASVLNPLSRVPLSFPLPLPLYRRLVCGTAAPPLPFHQSSPSSNAFGDWGDSLHPPGVFRPMVTVYTRIGLSFPFSFLTDVPPTVEHVTRLRRPPNCQRHLIEFLDERPLDGIKFRNGRDRSLFFSCSAAGEYGPRRQGPSHLFCAIRHHGSTFHPFGVPSLIFLFLPRVRRLAQKIPSLPIFFYLLFCVGKT